MKYISNLNDEIKDYYMILCNNNYPNFIDKYINTKELKRLDEIGFFCGCDYTQVFSCKYWYSRLHHSITCALMTWNFTKDKTQTLAALFHDLGTPAFSHCVDYLLGDALTQESSERNVEDIINSSTEIKKLLEENNINLKNVCDVGIYPIIENKNPKICVDRLDGIFSTCLIWIKYWNLKDIKEIYDNIIILKDENKNNELGFKNIEIANKFYEGTYEYSVVLQTDEDSFLMQFISQKLQYLIDNQLIKKEDLYSYSEKEVINIINSDNYLKKQWELFGKTNKVYKVKKKPKLEHYEIIETKKRYVIPLVLNNNKPIRLDKASNRCKELLDKYLKYEDIKYFYIKEDL